MNPPKSLITPPKAKKQAVKLVKHNHTRIDNYFWLREKENPKVISYLNEENAYREWAMEETKGLQENIFNEIKSRIKQTDMSVPYRSNGYYYYSRFEEGKDYPFYCRKKDEPKAKEEIMLNLNELASGYNYFNVGGMSVSPDNQLLAYSSDTSGQRIYSIHFKNLKTGENLPENIEGTSGNIAWAEDNCNLFYSLKEPLTLRTYKIFRYTLYEKGQIVKEIYEEKDETFSCAVYKTKSKKFIVIVSSANLSDEYRFIPANKPDEEFTIIQKRIRGLEYSISHFGEHFYIITNHEAENFRVMKTAVKTPGMENWVEMVPHRKEVFLSSFDIFNNFYVLSERINGLTGIRIIPWKNGDEHYLNFGEEVYDAYVSINPEFNTDILRFSYTSLTTPLSTFDYDMKSREKTLLKQQEVPGGYQSDEYVTKRIYASAEDGTRIPISLVYRKDMKKNEGNPLLLYGYGSYGITMDPAFSPVRLSLLDRGFVFAIAHIRGGQINGRAWYEDGKLMKKKNTFTDFIACGEFLISEQYCAPGHLYAMGGSAGGLLMGAVINMAPGLFHGIVASVPFVDVLTTMLDETIPLTTGEYDEWGNPNDIEYYDYILSYSPYDNIRAMDYPHMLIVTGINDSQVQYWEPAKWIAKLRELKTDSNYLLMYINMESGHGGASARFEKYRESALQYAFLLMLEKKNT